MPTSGSRLRAAVFDIGGVLFMEDSPGGFLGRWEEKFGMQPGQLLPLLSEGGDIERANIGEITGEEYCRRAAARVGRDEATMRALVEDAFAGEYVNRPLASYITTLRPRLQVAALTNTWSFGRSLMERHGLASLFDLIVSSAEEGVCKPDERIYHLTLERLGREPGEVAFVDDVQENVQAAKQLGIHAILYRSVEETTAELNALLEP
jgi:putative hydrolase of the HAD superfamily